MLFIFFGGNNAGDEGGDGDDDSDGSEACWLVVFLILSEKGLLSNTPAFASVFFMILILAA